MVFAARQIPGKSAPEWGPRKDFALAKDLWEKEVQALKTRCLPQGKYPKRAPLNGAPAKIFAKQKDLWGKGEKALS